MSIEYALYICIALLLCVYIVRIVSDDNKEGMGSKEGISKYFSDKYTELRNNEIYDTFYSSIYEKIFGDIARIKFETDKTIEHTHINKGSKLLDIGPGPGFQLKVFQKHAGSVKGVDKSSAMVQYASKSLPQDMVIQGDATNAMLFESHSFTHITAFYFTIYFFQDKRQFLSNVYKWLQKGGYFVVHLVNRKMFDPIVPPANPFILISPQKYAKERITDSTVKFKSFDYTSNFSLDDTIDKATFEETMKCKENGHIRKHIYDLHAPKLNDILLIAKEVGFQVIKKLDMIDCEYEYQYLYIMQK